MRFRKLDLFPSQARGETPTSLGPLITGLVRTEIDQFPKRYSLALFRIPNSGQKSENPVILSVIHHHQNPLESKRHSERVFNDSDSLDGKVW
jgi:hypothetical protein